MSTAPDQYILSTPWVSAWRCGAGVCRIQTTSPEIAAALSRWREACAVGESVTGGYLRLFDTNQGPHRLKRLLTRRQISADSLDEYIESQEAGVVR